MNPIRFLLVTALAASAVLPLSAQQNPSPAPIAPDLFIPRDDVRDPFLGRWAKIKRSQPVHVDINLLNQSVKGEVFRLQVLDKVYYARLDRKQMIPAIAGAYHWHCVLLGHETAEFAHCVLTVVGDGFAAWIHPQPGPYGLVVQGAPGMHCVREMGSGGKRHVASNFVPASPVPRSPEGACDDSISTISVLMVYDTTSRNQAGGTSKIQATMANALAQANVVMGNSKVTPRFVASAYWYGNYSANVPMRTELDRLTYTRGSLDPMGYLDGVHGRRASQRADLVTMFVGDVSAHGNVIGIAWRPGFPSQFRAIAGFSVTEWNSSNGAVQNTLVHEFGHNFGCGHDQGNATGPHIYPYAYGYRLLAQTFSFPVCMKSYLHTIMSYTIKSGTCGKCLGSTNYRCVAVHVPVFSNPQAVFGGRWLGNSTSDNARTIGNTAQAIANYGWDVAGWRTAPRITSQPKSLVACLGYQASPLRFTVGQTGGTKYRWLKDGRAIPNATRSVYTLPQTITAAHAGLYRCRVSGPCYTTHSSSVRLTVSSSCRNGMHVQPYPGADFGDGLVELGDVNGDGYKDFAASMPGATINNRASAGSLHIYSGKDGVSLTGSGWVGGQVNDRLGSSLAAGDIDGDGKPDLIAGAAGYFSGRGAVYWVSSKDKRMRRARVGFTGQRLGRWITSAQYLDRDGVHDVVASAGTRVYAFAGRHTSGPWAQLWWRDCASTVASIATLGDLNGDGYDDIGVGCSGYNSQRGRVEILSGKDGSPIRFHNGNQAGEVFGHSIAGLGGDITGDRIPDYIVGSPGLRQASGNSWEGRVTWWNGATGAPLGSMTGGNRQRLSWQVAGSGDYDNDGYADALVSTYPLSTSVAGAAIIVSGRTKKAVGTYTGPTSRFGARIAAMDTNGDSRMDVLVTDGSQGRVYTYDAAPKANPPAQLAYGAICPDSKGRLARGSHSLDPRIGKGGALYLDAAPPSSTTFLSVGLRRTSPLSLDFIRMTGCYSHVNPVVELGGIPTSSLGRVAVPSNLPNDASLIGGRAWFQWYPIDFGLPSSRLQVTASNGYEVKIGAR